jgi:hypothetical protein
VFTLCPLCVCIERELADIEPKHVEPLSGASKFVKDVGSPLRSFHIIRIVLAPNDAARYTLFEVSRLDVVTESPRSFRQSHWP